MSIGSTSGKEPDAILDEDLRTPEQLRGDMKSIREASLSVGEKASVAGVMTEIQVLKQQLKMTHEQMQTLISIYGTMRDEFDQFKRQRIIELRGRGGGSTTPEDMEDGS